MSDDARNELAEFIDDIPLSRHGWSANARDVAEALIDSDWLDGVKAEAGRAALMDAADETRESFEAGDETTWHAVGDWLSLLATQGGAQ